jgi:hypothetical protein
MIRMLAAAALLASLAVPADARSTPDSRAPALIATEFDCDALATSQRLDAATLRDLEPAHSLDDAAAVLNRHGVKYQRTQGAISLDGLPQRELRHIVTLPQGEPIILPNGDGAAICVLRPSADSI